VAGFDPQHVYQDGHNPQRLDTIGLNSQLSYKFDGLGTLFSVTGYEKGWLFSRGDIDGGANYAFFTGVPPTTVGSARFAVETGGQNRPEEFTQELRFASEKFGDLSFQAGTYYFNQNLDGGGKGSGSWNTDGSFNQGSTSHLDNETYAAFGSVEYTPTDQLILRGGLRWSHDKKHSVLYSGLPESSSKITFGDASGSKVSWDASATYKFTPDMSAYARVATGYLGTSIKNDLVSGIPSIAKPETTTSYEVGFKGQSSGMFSYSIDGYYWNTKNIQLTAVGGGSNVTTLVNADKAVGYGLEAEFTARPIEHLELTAGGSYNHTEIKDARLGVAIPSYTVTVLDPLKAPGIVYIDGNPLPQAPKWSANFTAGYTVPLSDDTELFAFTDWAYRSKVNFFLYQAVEFTGRSSLEGGLKVGYRDKVKHFEVAAFGRNITNQIRAVGAIDFDDLTTMINEPRILGVEFSASY
jgi:iron complex outermembrane receptor protein